MTNPLKGETSVSTPEATYRLVFDINALAALEALLGVSAIVVINRIEKERLIGDLRALFWAGLQEFHDDIDLKAAGRLIHEIGLEDLASKMLTSIQAAFPAAKPAGKGGGKGAARPQTTAAKTADGTGSTSTASGES